MSTDTKLGNLKRKIKREPLGIIGHNRDPSTILKSVKTPLEKEMHVRQMLKKILSLDLSNTRWRTSHNVACSFAGQHANVNWVHINANPPLAIIWASKIDLHQ